MNLVVSKCIHPIYSYFDSSYNNIFVLYCSYIIPTYLGECCKQLHIQSDGPASVYHSLGDYEQNGNDSTIYTNIMGTGEFLFKASDGLWMVCTKCQCSLFK